MVHGLTQSDHWFDIDFKNTDCNCLRKHLQWFKCYNAVNTQTSEKGEFITLNDYQIYLENTHKTIIFINLNTNKRKYFLFHSVKRFV